MPPCLIHNGSEEHTSGSSVCGLDADNRTLWRIINVGTSQDLSFFFFHCKYDIFIPRVYGCDGRGYVDEWWMQNQKVKTAGEETFACAASLLFVCCQLPERCYKRVASHVVAFLFSHTWWTSFYSESVLLLMSCSFFTSSHLQAVQNFRL